ncbi:MAG TPA: hypothetical protein VGJ95_00990 [Pseudonocardiaceae bacterium]
MPALLAGLGLLVVAAFAGTSVAVGAIGGSTTTYSSSTSSTTDTSTSSTTDTSTSTETTTTTTETTTTTTPPPPPPGGQGCTPGFWKNHPDAFATTPYSPTTTLGSVFTGLSPSYASLTFAQALNLGSGGLNALLRHAVAALLNASSSEVDYPLSAAQVIAMTNAAIASGNYEPTKNLFDAANNLETPGFCD